MIPQGFQLTEQDLDRAFAENEFLPVYQPLINLKNGDLLGAEVFVRWQHPELGTLPPGVFLPFVSSRNRMPALSDVIISHALDARSHWPRRHQGWSISINLAAADIADLTLPKRVEQLLEAHKLSPASLTLEAAEGDLTTDPYGGFAKLQPLREMGVTVALESRDATRLGKMLDTSFFTNEYIDRLKLGGNAILSFARNEQSPARQRIIDCIRAARDSNVPLIAVGVESQTALVALRDIGFSAAQGTYISRPIEATEVPHLKNEHLDVLTHPSLDWEQDKSTRDVVETLNKPTNTQMVDAGAGDWLKALSNLDWTSIEISTQIELHGNNLDVEVIHTSRDELTHLARHRQGRRIPGISKKITMQTTGQRASDVTYPAPGDTHKKVPGSTAIRQTFLNRILGRKSA